MNLFKALVPGALLSWIGASIIGRGGASGGILNIQTFLMHGQNVHWSWPLFLVGTGLAWFVFSTID